MSAHSVTIHTDGSCLGNPGPGGWAARLACNGTVKSHSGGFALTTPCTVSLHTDSRYVCDAVEKRWLANWQRKNWRKADGKPVLNQDLWELLLKELARHKVRFHWVEAHAGHQENEEVDTLARLAATRPGLPRDAGFARS